eukprot:TRINITY_DN4362_c1_g1_i1.p3 TRINITY_DN4362_c1_g1~~TRINITY_DN4362_c1_g1_i1.p3  ORF type:complete len:237 (+),score=80.33 TRINITY_DN4362_c1_g1_i1:76-711(+)
MTAAAPICAGAPVQAQWYGGGWYYGAITRDNGDGTYGVRFAGEWDDGNYMPRVPAHQIALYPQSCTVTPPPALPPSPQHSVRSSTPPQPGSIPSLRASTPSLCCSPLPTAAEAEMQKVLVSTEEEFADSVKTTLEYTKAILAEIAGDRCGFSEDVSPDGKPRFAVTVPRPVFTKMRKHVELCWNRDYCVKGARWVWTCSDSAAAGHEAGVH